MHNIVNENRPLILDTFHRLAVCAGKVKIYVRSVYLSQFEQVVAEVSEPVQNKTILHRECDGKCQ
jgi:hypothetical protein